MARESSEQKRARLGVAASRELRKLSGWNIFQREHIGGESSYDQKAWSLRVKELARAWASLPSEEHAAFQVQAEHEELQRHEVQNTPLPAKGVVASHLEEQVGPRALGKISSGRLALNMQNAHSHPIWLQSNQLGDRHLHASFVCSSECPATGPNHSSKQQVPSIVLVLVLV